MRQSTSITGCVRPVGLLACWSVTLSFDDPHGLPRLVSVNTLSEKSNPSEMKVKEQEEFLVFIWETFNM